LSGDAEFFHLDAKLDPESGYHIFRVATVPEDWQLQVGVILGDIVQNLRSALDYLFWQLYCHYIRVPRSHREAQQVQFPIEDTSQRLANKRANFSKIPLSQWAVIESAQPYQGPHSAGRTFGVLRDLSNRDKHQVLNPPLLTTTAFSLYGNRIPFNRVTRGMRTPKPSERLEVGAEIVRMPFPPDVDAEVEMAGHGSPDVRLPELDIAIMRGVDKMIYVVKLIVGDTRAEL